ncbi:hypothetical protein CEXT_680391 [Caerostris extrusa]|uniref:Uncharacterized protein n=1 Tax=Caerostris extrusa TaxID=172846 RepID=A0AAV4NZW7_CAEEX|nr:hypothetical protein CEXT_680391 [Caerostris extrusa]
MNTAMLSRGILVSFDTARAYISLHKPRPAFTTVNAVVTCCSWRIQRRVLCQQRSPASRSLWAAALG